jgi:hypothetical protein
MCCGFVSSRTENRGTQCEHAYLWRLGVMASSRGCSIGDLPTATVVPLASTKVESGVTHIRPATPVTPMPLNRK